MARQVAGSVSIGAYIAYHDCGGILAAQVAFGPAGKPPTIPINGVRFPTVYHDGTTVDGHLCTCPNPQLPERKKARKLKLGA